MGSNQGAKAAAARFVSDSSDDVLSLSVLWNYAFYTSYTRRFIFPLHNFRTKIKYTVTVTATVSQWHGHGTVERVLCVLCVGIYFP
jgi:hypothetical protein